MHSSGGLHTGRGERRGEQLRVHVLVHLLLHRLVPCRLHPLGDLSGQLRQTRRRAVEQRQRRRETAEVVDRAGPGYRGERRGADDRTNPGRGSDRPS